jgi:hypothetical protein
MATAVRSYRLSTCWCLLIFFAICDLRLSFSGVELCKCVCSCVALELSYSRCSMGIVLLNLPGWLSSRNPGLYLITLAADRAGLVGS